MCHPAEYKSPSQEAGAKYFIRGKVAGSPTLRLLFRPNAQLESIGLDSSLRSRVEHGIDRLPHGGRCIL